MLCENKVIVITGGSGGLGTDFARSLAREGATLILTGTSDRSLENVKSEMEKMGAKYEAYVLNVTDKARVNEVFAQVAAKYGRIDILINNAGGSLFTPKSLPDIKEEDWDLVLDVNLKGTFLCSQAVVPYMRKQKSGKIINLTSAAAREASVGTGVAYAAAKGGVISFSRRLAKEVGPDGITVNSIAPGFVMSGDRLRDLWNEMTDEQQRDQLSKIPLGRLGSGEETARVIVFLCSYLSDYMTGVVLDVNGGRVMV